MQHLRFALTSIADTELGNIVKEIHSQQNLTIDDIVQNLKTWVFLNLNQRYWEIGDLNSCQLLGNLFDSKLKILPEERLVEVKKFKLKLRNAGELFGSELSLTFINSNVELNSIFKINSLNAGIDISAIQNLFPKKSSENNSKKIYSLFHIEYKIY